MTGVSWRPGCPVALDALHLLTVSYRTADATARRGELVVNADAVDAITRAFRRLFDANYPITKMRLIDEYGGDDERSMNDDNTSAFNCRPSTGGTTWSQHAYGRAVDINPFENPWVKGNKVDPPAAARYADRSRTGRKMIHRGDAVWRAFVDVGWGWGGDFQSLKDYQHFSANGL
jgi:D-alanyl-D-alanine carboxypeptidase-like protein